MSLIVVPRKRATAVDFPGKLGKFISNKYSPQDAAQHNEGVKALGEMRGQCMNANDPSEENREKGLRYWAQIALLDHRIDFNQVGMVFEWHDAFGKGKMTSVSMHLEIAAVLFNTAVLFLHAGAKEHQIATSDAFKNALVCYKRAAGMLTGVKNAAAKIDGIVTRDLSQDSLTMLHTLAMAHAQRCFFEQAEASKKSAAVLSKVAGGCADLYAEAQAPTQAGDLAKHLKNTTLCQELEIEAIATETKGTKKGHEIGHLTKAVAKLTAARDLAKRCKPARADGVAKLLAEAQAALAEAHKENNTIYHMSEENVADPEGKVLVKEDPLPPPLDVVGTDRFGALVPESVQRSAYAYAAQRQDYVNKMVMDMQQNTEAVRARLLPITPQLEACDASEPGVPARLRERLPAIQQQGAGRGLGEKYSVTVGMRDEARLQVEAARAAIEAEERVDSELRRKFGARWSRSLSSSINAPLRKDLDAIDKQLALAAKADETVQGKLEGSKALLDLLDQPAENLDALVAGSSDPSQAMQEATSVEKAQRLVAELKAVVYDIERLLTARDAIRVQAISHKDSEDAVRVLSVYILQGTAPEAAFKALLGQYQGFREKFVANHGEVEAALLKLEEGNARFLEARQQSAEVSRREMAIKDISMAIDAFTEIAAYVREGQSWYTAMQEKIARVRERAEDFKVARDIQKEDLIEAIAEQSAREPPPPAVQIVAQPVAAQPAAAPSLSAPSFSAAPSGAPDTSRDEEIARQLAGLGTAPPAPAPPVPAPPAPRPPAPPPDTSRDAEIARRLAAGESIAGLLDSGAPVPPPAAARPFEATPLEPFAAPPTVVAPAAPTFVAAPAAAHVVPPPPVTRPTIPSIHAAPLAPTVPAAPPPPVAAPPPPPAVQLPPGWEMMLTPEGEAYYVNHNDQSTHWDPPGPEAFAAAGVGYVNARPS